MARYRDTLIPALLWAGIYFALFVFGQWMVGNGDFWSFLGWVISVIALVMGAMTILHTWHQLRATSMRKQVAGMMSDSIEGQANMSGQLAEVDQNLEKGDMNVIPVEQFVQETLGGRPNQMDMSPYEGSPFQCACGETHTYRSSTVPVLRELPGSKLVLSCPDDDAVTCVKVKGIIRFKGFESLFGANTGQNRGKNARNGRTKWVFRARDSISSTPVIGRDGTIYIGSWDNNLYAVNPDGTEQWAFETDGHVSDPTVGPRGIIYVSSGKCIYAINPDGTQKWRFGADNKIMPPKVGPNGTIYAGSLYGSLYAIHPNGTEQWRLETSNGQYSLITSPAVGTDGTLFAGSRDGSVHALKLDGTEQWQFDTGDEVMSPTIGTDGTLFVGSRDGHLYALTMDGVEQWKLHTGASISSSPALGPNGSIYFGVTDQRLYAVSHEGAPKWHFDMGSNVLSSPVVDSDGTIYVGCDDHRMYAISPDGIEKWHFETDNWIQSSPAIGPDGTIYIGSYDGNLYALDKEIQN